MPDGSVLVIEETEDRQTDAGIDQHQEVGRHERCTIGCPNRLSQRAKRWREGNRTRLRETFNEVPGRGLMPARAPDRDQKQKAPILPRL